MVDDSCGIPSDGGSVLILALKPLASASLKLVKMKPFEDQRHKFFSTVELYTPCSAAQRVKRPLSRE